MPRLHVWAAGAISIAALYHVVYHRAFLPRMLAQRDLEERLGKEKHMLHDVMQQYAFADRVSRGDLCGRSKSPSQSPSSSSRSSTVSRSSMSRPCRVGSANATENNSLLHWFWRSNRDMLTFYCQLQRVRQALHQLPMRAQSRSDKQYYLNKLADMQCRGCRALHGRLAALSVSQRARCALCYVIYVICFQCLPLLWRCDSVWRRVVLHRSARWIVGTLEITCDMSIDASMQTGVSQRNEACPNTGTNDSVDRSCCGHSCATPCASSCQADHESWQLLLPTQHWLEEVGFWACANNPLLVQAIRTNCSTTASRAGVAKDEADTVPGKHSPAKVQARLVLSSLQGSREGVVAADVTGKAIRYDGVWCVPSLRWCTSCTQSCWHKNADTMCSAAHEEPHPHKGCPNAKGADLAGSTGADGSACKISSAPIVAAHRKDASVCNDATPLVYPTQDLYGYPLTVSLFPRNARAKARANKPQCSWASQGHVRTLCTDSNKTEHAGIWLPVGVAGLTHVLSVPGQTTNAAAIAEDVREQVYQHSREAEYERIFRQQYIQPQRLGTAAPDATTSVASTPTSTTTYENATSTQPVAPLREESTVILQRLAQWSISPMWQCGNGLGARELVPMWWWWVTGVYGVRVDGLGDDSSSPSTPAAPSSSYSGVEGELSRSRCTLHYHIGRPCASAAEVMAAMLDATETAIHAAYPV